MTKKMSVVILALMFCQVSAAAGSFQEKRLEFTVPGCPWILTLPADDFQLAEKKMRDDGRGAYFYLSDEKQHLNLSMFIEPVKDCNDSKSCRDMIWKLGNPEWVNPKNIVQSQIGDISTLELMVPKFQGMDLRQQNVYAEFVVEGFWVDMHLSKVLYKPEEHSLFERIVSSVRFEPKKKSESLSPLAANAPADRPQDVTADQTRKFQEAIRPYVQKARETFPEARARYLKGLPPRHVFFVTARLTDSAGRWEQVFIEVKEIKNGIVLGVIASDIRLVSGFKYGDQYSLPESDLIDWTISKPDGTEEGNFVGKFLDTYKPE